MVVTCGAALSLSGLAAAAERPPAPAARTAAPPPAWVKVSTCHHGASALGRFATFYARMSRVQSTRRMSVRFTLQEAVGEGRFERVAAPGLDRWRVSRAGVARFGYRQTVRGLRQDSAYRAQVGFRWYGRGGKVIRRAVRRSGVCSYVRRPNLRVVAVSARPGAEPGRTAYQVTVRNLGKVAAPAAGVALSVDGGALGAVTSSPLSAGQASTVLVSGPACTRGVRARVDPAGAIRESNESDNGYAADCPVVRS